jgi:hypothetical protein
MLSLIHTLGKTLKHLLIVPSLLCLQSLPGDGFQRRALPLLWVPELSPCLSYQLLTATAHNDWTATVLWLTAHQPTHFTPLYSTALCSIIVFLTSITSGHGQHRRQIFCCCIHCSVRSHRRRSHRKHRFPSSPLVCVRNLLSRNGRCLHRHYLATGLHAATARMQTKDEFILYI